MEKRFETFTVLIASINRCIRKIKTEEMAEFDLKSPHVSCLYYLYRAGSMTAKELSDICDEDKANISRAVKHLEESGYVVCHAKCRKRYQSPLELTDLGRQVGCRIAEKIDRILGLASEGLSEEDRRVLYQSLALVHENLQAICERYEADGE